MISKYTKLQPVEKIGIIWAHWAFHVSTSSLPLWDFQILIGTSPHRPHQEEREARILVLGLDNAGKTTILKKMSDEDITHIMPTQGATLWTFQIHIWVFLFTLSTYIISFGAMMLPSRLQYQEFGPGQLQAETWPDWGGRFRVVGGLHFWRSFCSSDRQNVIWQWCLRDIVWFLNCNFVKHADIRRRQLVDVLWGKSSQTWPHKSGLELATLHIVWQVRHLKKCNVPMFCCQCTCRSFELQGAWTVRLR